MTSKFNLKVGPSNRHAGYADPITVYADNFSQAKSKALRISGWGRNGQVWLVSIEECAPVICPGHSVDTPTTN